MATYLLTWNPKKTPFEGIDIIQEEIEIDGSSPGNWSCGKNKSIQKGDRVFLLRQKVEPRGLVSSGRVTKGSHKRRHWADRSKFALYVAIDWDVFAVEPIIPRDTLDSPHLAGVNWNTQVSGIRIPDEIAEALEEKWAVATGSLPPAGTERPANEVPDPQRYVEGATTRVSVEKHERDPRARRASVEHHGCFCGVCGFDFEEVYGDIGQGFIHVHHIVPLSEIDEQYTVDPIKDLLPVCPNCHEMIHRKKPPYKPKEIKKMLRLKK